MDKILVNSYFPNHLKELEKEQKEIKENNKNTPNIDDQTRAASP